MHPKTRVRAGALPLVEREDEVAALENLLAAARSGTGGATLVEGPAGIGKTRLLIEARELAVASGMTVLHGLGTEVESEFPMGVVRQCLQPAVRRQDERRRLLTGAAALVEPLLVDTGEPIEAVPGGLLAGLYWLVANLADESPVLLVVDDAQWVDEPSIGFLGYLARRIDSVAAALVVAARTEADYGAAPPALVDLRRTLREVRVEPAALGTQAVGRLLGEIDEGSADERFVEACHRATGGNPFLLEELMRALVSERLPFDEAAAARVAELNPPGLAHALDATLERLRPGADALARAVAILGDGTSLELAAELAEMATSDAQAVATELVRAEILEDSAALRFRHPILIGAARARMSAQERAVAHARAAELLRRRHAGPERVALQLLHSSPAADPRAVDELRRAAGHARERGAPLIAVRLLQRALDESPGSALRPELLVDLAAFELDSGRTADAADHLAEAHAVTEDPLVRGRALALLAVATPGEAEARRRLAELVERTLPDVEPLDRELALRLRALLVIEGGEWRDLRLDGDSPGEAIVLGHLVFALMGPDTTADEIADIAGRGARQVDHLLEEGAIALAFTGIALGLRWSDRLEAAERLLNRAIAVAHRRGSTMDHAIAMTLRAAVRRRGGRLRDAEADARTALATDMPDDWLFTRGIAPLAGSLLDQGRVEEASAELASVVPNDEIDDSPPMTPVLLTRMAVRAASRDHAGALADWREALRRGERLRGIGPAWIEDLAVVTEVHLALGDRASAEATSDRALQLARRWATPGAMGQAMRARARVGVDDGQIGLVMEAVEMLAASPARLEHARALVTLGGALRRRGRRVDGRERLREGYELARWCGADSLAEAARAELRASGVRLRRSALSGVDSLTPSERRIADMAAAGLSNAEIAQGLFLTVKTVEMHLTNTYRKLDIEGRPLLARTLARKT